MTPTQRLTILVCGLVITVLPTSGFAQRLPLADRRRQEFQERHRSALADLSFELRTLSRQCIDRNMPQAAADLTAISLELTSRETVSSFPSMVQLPVNPQLPADEQWWRTRLTVLRTDAAKKLYILARSALNSRPRMPSMAYRIVLDVVRINPDHTHARAVLGQKLFRDPLRKNDPTYAGEWVSPFEATKRSGSRPEMNHPRYGWIPVSYEARYDEGLRPWRGEWISVQKEAELRRHFNNHWEVRSEHFEVLTNTSLEEGVEISRKLETFYKWMQSNFAAFFDTPEALAERFEQVEARRRGRVNVTPMTVHYYASQEEYDQQMRGKIPPNISTNGFYWEPDQTSYFFRNPDANDFSTVFHEATHQILDHATRLDRRKAARLKQRVLRQRREMPWVLCEKSNFWMIEGLACYLESFQINEGVVSVGRPDHVRFKAAQHRLLKSNFFINLFVFSSYGQLEFQKHPNLAQLYSQASGVMHFLLHYKDGMYRDDFVTLLSAAYRPDLKHITQEPRLDKITGVPFTTLDQQYREHIGNMVIEIGQAQAGK